MKAICKIFSVIVAGIFIVYPFLVRAGEPAFLSVAVGHFDLVQDHNQATEFRVEYRSNKAISMFKPFSGIMGTNDSTLYAYGGFLLDLFYGPRFVVTPSLAVGYYEKGDGKDLGHELEFRSSVELSYRFDDRSRIGLSFYHLSNASISSKNPGTEVLSIVYSIPLTQ